ncbi:MAG: SDR family oxidoreductase [Pseudobacter sp.]|uniref:SDR family oxidoreductase n=1 Tax=Pseudobacter sp. TaxID=2045420 RepID=UPI003F80EEB8
MKKNIIVTGSSSGFGLLTVKTLAAAGHTVYATMRNIETKNASQVKQLKDWAAANNADIRVFELDVTSDVSVNKAVSDIARDSNGRIDVLVNNAGLFVWGLSEEVTTSQLEDIFRINVFGVDRVIKAVLPYMRKLQDGLLITISSGLARLHLPYLGAYQATKAAVDVLGTTYHYELKKSGIDSLIIQPGAMKTDLFSKKLETGNGAIEEAYGEYGQSIRRGVEALLSPKPESADPQVVADSILETIGQSKTERKLWTVLGIGPVQPAIEAINSSTGALSSGVMEHIGIS